MVRMLVLAAMLCGCETLDEGSLPQAELPVPTPPEWTSSHRTTPPPDLYTWADDFRDALLTDLVHDGLAHNFSLQASRAGLQAASMTVNQRLAVRAPQVSWSADAAKSLRVDPERGRQGGGTSAGLGLGVSVAWELDVWNRLQHEATAAARDFEAAAWTDQGARLAIAVTIARQYCDAISAKKRQALAEQNIASFARTLAVAEDRFADGLLNGATDVHLARANVANAQQALHRAKREYDAAVRTLEALVGRYPQAALNTADGLPRVEPVPAGLLSDLLLRRPDVRAAEARVSAAGLRHLAARAKAFPSLRLTASTGTSADTLSKILHPSHVLWSMASGLTQPIFDGGAIAADSARTSALQQQAIANYAQVALTAYQEVETALAAEQFLSAELMAGQTAAVESAAAQEETAENYEQGLADLTAVLVAQRRSVEAQRSLITTTNRRLQNRLGLYMALGGGFAREEVTR